jgi:hypothetical protein
VDREPVRISKKEVAVPSWAQAALFAECSPVGPSGEAYQATGSIGLAPSWLVFLGAAGGVEQVSDGPQP